MSSKLFTACLVVLVAVFAPAFTFPNKITRIESDNSSVIGPVMRLYNIFPDDGVDPTFTIETSENRASISAYYEDVNTVAGYCVTGTWIVYSMSNYTNGGVGGLVVSNDTKVCVGRSWPPIASFRRAGSSTDINTPALTVYATGGYRGSDTVYSQEASVLPSSFDSLIITGNRPITIFSRENFGGFSMCIDAPQNGVGGGIRNITESLGLLPGEIKSFRFNCSPDITRVSLEKNYK